MAGVFLEAQAVYGRAFDVRVIPGVPSMVTIAAKLGAPLQNGFTVISVADEDTPFAVIEQRLRGAALGGGVIVLYKLILENLYYPPDRYPELYPPAEKTRYRWERACAILSEHIPPERPMAIVTDACDQTSHYSSATRMLGSDDHKESIVIVPFQEFLARSGAYRFFTTVIIGDATTKRYGDILVTPQWNYKWTYAKEMMNDLAGLPYLKEQEEFLASLGRPPA
jgi:precorrin-3B methylase